MAPPSAPDRFDPDRVEAFHHRGWDLDQVSGTIRLRYALDGLVFEEHFDLPPDGLAAAGGSLERALDVLAVCAGTSYYKAAAAAVVTGVPEWLVPFARDLYLHGLAEYAMTNGLDPVRPEFVPAPGPAPSVAAAPSGGPALVAMGGGKDSIVTLESARRAGRVVVAASVSSHPSIEAAVAVAAVDHLVVGRRLDPNLLALNERGARNGHVPVTAINSAALAVLAAGMGAEAVVMSNEWSASVAVARYRDLPVNHQWSKGIDCERALAALLPVPYFSLLRSLHEVEICRRFVALAPYFPVVTSCNRAYTAAGRAAGVRWCGACPKCRFVFLGLAASAPPAVVTHIFDGADLLDDDSAVEAYRAILGLGGPPPMECVGTTHESRWAMFEVAEHPEWRHRAVVRALIGAVDVVAGWCPLTERGTDAVPPGWHEARDALA